MTNSNEWRTAPPSECPYCGTGDIARLADHLPCDAVPDTDDVINA